MGLAPQNLRGWLLVVALGAGCGRGGETSAGDRPTPPSEAAGKDAGEDSVPPAGETDHGLSDSEPGADAGAEEQERDRVPLEVEFHRTRVGPGDGFWVLAQIHNGGQTAIDAVRVEVSLLDEAGTNAGRVSGRLRRAIAADESAAIAVLVERPPVHEQLELKATARALEGAPPVAPPLHLEHAPPQRADLGGWFVSGQVRNDGSEAVAGARVEILGLDEAGKLLGVDWLELEPVAPGETVRFSVTELRYDEQPATLRLTLRPPAS